VSQPKLWIDASYSKHVPHKYRRTDRSSTQAMARLHSFGSVLEAGHNASSLGLKRKEKKRKEKHTTSATFRLSSVLFA